MQRLRTPFAAACLGAIVLSAPLPPAQTFSADFARPGLVGRVFATATWNKLLVAGGLSLQARGGALGHLAAFDGRAWRALGGKVLGDVRAITTYRGELVVAGEVGSAGGVIVDGIARFDGVRWRALPGGPRLSFRTRPTIFALAVYAGELYAAGYFDRLGSKVVRGVARWNGTRWADVGGSVNGSFQPMGLSLAVWGNELYVGGSFDRAGTVAVANVAVWNGRSWGALGGGLPGALRTGVWALEPFGGKLYAGGNFRRAGSVPADRLAAWDGKAWTAVGGGIPSVPISTTVYALEAWAGSLWVGGNFSRVVSRTGPAASRLARWDGARWHSLGGVAGSDLKTTVFDLTVWNGRLVIGGEFSRAGTSLAVGQAVVSESIVAFDGARFAQLGRGLGLDAEPRGLAHWNGGVVAVGRFVEAGGSLTTTVAWFDGRDWQALGSFDGQVEDAVAFRGDLVVTGAFRRIDGRPISGTARYDGKQWRAMTGAGGQALAISKGSLYAGGLGNVARWTGTTWQRLGSIFGFVLAMHEHGGLLYIGGSSLRAPSLPSSPNLIAWNGSKLVGVGGGVSDAVEALASHGGKLVVGGRFQRAGATTARRIATWDGRTWGTLGNGFGAAVHALGVLRGRLYAGGSFNRFTRDPADYFALWNGSAWVQVAGGLDGAPLALLADEVAHELWIGGLIGHAGGQAGVGVPSWRMARLEHGERWRNLGHALAGSDGEPLLTGAGALRGGARIELRLAGARAGAAGVVALGAVRADLPLFGGLLVPAPQEVVEFRAGARGTFAAGAVVPPGVPRGARVLAQAWILDPGAAQGLAASNAIEGIAP